MPERNLAQMLESWRGALEVTPSGEVVVTDRRRLREEAVDGLARLAAFGAEGDRERARAIIWEAARQSGIRPASIQPLYEAMGRGEVGGFTTPAFNLRGLVYDKARAVVASALELRVGAFIFELARSETGYTDQRPGEYASVVLAAALREGFEGPLFVQGDHYQVSAARFAQGGEARAAEIRAIKDLIREAVEAGYGNIDVDASTIVDLSQPTVKEQQRDNVEASAELMAWARTLQPPGMTLSLGGEIGEVGRKNSTPEELRAYMDGLLQELERRAPGARGPSKISVQTGTTHGGVVLPDGTVAEVRIDFDCLREISDVARREYGMAGAVQHGASTLPPEAFDRFPEATACEVHLATDFQNLVLDHPVFPKDLRAEMYAWLDRECAAERKPDMTPEQFYYKTRKKAWGPFKRAAWDLPTGVREELRAALRAKFALLFRKLGATDTAGPVRERVRPPEFKRTLPG